MQAEQGICFRIGMVALWDTPGVVEHDPLRGVQRDVASFQLAGQAQCAPVSCPGRACRDGLVQKVVEGFMIKARGILVVPGHTSG